jgi:hypothetical protein
MDEKSKRIRAEDILTDEKLLKEIISSDAHHIEDVDKSEVQVARYIYLYWKSRPKVLSIFEKEQLKKRLEFSIPLIDQEKKIYSLRIAAAVLLLCGLTGIWYYHSSSVSEITRFAQNMGPILPDADTRLILQGGEEIRIDQKESQIKYDQNGAYITIGSDQKVDQKIISKEPVFNTVIVPYGKRTQITLSEGTNVWLNSGSKLIYPVFFAKNNREVYIEGEAIFEVTHNDLEPFIVNTRDFGIQVLGTVFNVSSYPDDKYSSTVLERGSVKLRYKGGALLSKSELTMTPGDMAVYDSPNQEINTQKVNPQDHMSWRDGYFNFKKERMCEILKKLGRYYNVVMVLEDDTLKNETFSGRLDLKNSPADVLKVIEKTIPLNTRYENEKLIINLK